MFSLTIIATLPYLHRQDRLSRGGGGVASYVSDAYYTSECIIPGDNRAFELLWIRLKATKDSVSMLFGALYHPPKPLYKTSDLYEHIERSFDEVLRAHPDDTVVLAGDFSQLSLTEISSRTGLIP